MIGFIKRRYEKRGRRASALGHLEFQVMEILWTQGESNVRDVAQSLQRPLAYTTVMTTLDRLFKKGLLARRKMERAFLYAPLLTRAEWDQREADDWVAGFLAGAQSSGELLVSCFVDAIGTHDEKLLTELERKIKLKRKELSKRGSA